MQIIAETVKYSQQCKARNAVEWAEMKLLTIRRYGPGGSNEGQWTYSFDEADMVVHLKMTAKNVPYIS